MRRCRIAVLRKFLLSDVSTSRGHILIYSHVATFREHDRTSIAESEDFYSDDEELTSDVIHKAYREIHDKCIKVCKLNKALGVKFAKLTQEKEVLKRGMVNQEFLVIEKDRKIQEIKA